MKTKLTWEVKRIELGEVGDDGLDTYYEVSNGQMTFRADTEWQAEWLAEVLTANDLTD